jgi:transposase
VHAVLTKAYLMVSSLGLPVVSPCCFRQRMARRLWPHHQGFPGFQRRETLSIRVRVELPAALTTGEAQTPVRLKSKTMLPADRGYDADWIRALAAERGVWANIPPRCNRSEQIRFSLYLHRARNLVERFFDQALPSGCNPLRQARGELPRLHPTCINPALAAR